MIARNINVVGAEKQSTDSHMGTIEPESKQRAQDGDLSGCTGSSWVDWTLGLKIRARERRHMPAILS